MSGEPAHTTFSAGWLMGESANTITSLTTSWNRSSTTRSLLIAAMKPGATVQVPYPIPQWRLFEPLGDYNWSKIDIHLPNRLFTNTDHVDEGVTGTGVLDVFDRYNFTVNEAEPLEKEVAIDPEMLGKGLREPNRGKQAKRFRFVLHSA